MESTRTFQTCATFLAVLAVLSSCSPVYQTHYNYYPISGREGQMCSNTCLVARQSCVQNEQQRYQACESQANLQYQMCELSKVYNYDSKGNWVCVVNCFCFKPSCASPSIGSCEEFYKDCYLNCGGEVVATTSCVSNCEEAVPAQTQRLKKNEYGSVVDVTNE
jgi:hypothetical protein